MSLNKFLIPLSVALLGIVIFFGFKNWRKHEAKTGSLDSRLKQLTLEIRESSGKSHCDGSGQCKVIGLGTRNCGEFKDYLIYSLKDVDEPHLLSLIEDFNDTHRKLSETSLAVGVCGVKPSPIRCVNGRCVPEK